MRLLRFLFGLSAPVGRRDYALVGFGLMALKYAVDALAVWHFTGAAWLPSDYLSPLWETRRRTFGPESSAFQLGLVLWTLPFLWIGMSMTLRRTLDAGFGPAWALLFFVPFLNYAWLLFLCAPPSRPRAAPRGVLLPAVEPDFQRALAGVAVGCALAGVLFVAVVYGLRSYGSALFVGAPVLLGAASAYVYNRGALRPAGDSVALGITGVLIASGALLLFAAEGAICLVMALPLGGALAVAGALLGREIARAQTAPASAALVLPLFGALFGGAEGLPAPAHRYEATTTIAIAAPPDAVWRQVVSFGELPAPDWLLFRLGLAHPLRARIEGSGVGAVRRCEFSTGAFVEPITVWDAPRRLAFDVIAQPPPMRELSPWADVHPPHLTGGFRSVRGEFRLIPDGAGGTRLEGSTWYELDFAPAGYWRLWTDFFLHRIHGRVLAHVKRLAEAEAEAAAPL